jgi:hypothetical protein
LLVFFGGVVQFPGKEAQVVEGGRRGGFFWSRSQWMGMGDGARSLSPGKLSRFFSVVGDDKQLEMQFSIAMVKGKSTRYA